MGLIIGGIDILRQLCSMKVQAVHLGNLFLYAKHKGMDEEILRSKLNDERVDVCNEESYISSADYLTAFETLANFCNDPFFGLHYGFFLNIKSLGFITTLSCQTVNIEQAVLIVQHYLQYSFPIIELEAKREKGKYILTLKYNSTDEMVRKHIADTVFCFIYRELILMLPAKTTMYLACPNGNTTEYAKFFTQETVLKKNHVIFFDDNILNQLINQKTAREVDILLPHFLKILDKEKEGYKPFSVRVRNMTLNMCHPELPTFEQVCSQFNYSQRTIQRKLADEDITFRKIADDIKKELHIYLTTGNSMKTQDIAYTLGYSEPSAYLHAVKRWKFN